KTPALREHPGDVYALVEHFVQSACRRNGWKPRRFAPQALDLLRRQPWRGNVRELKNVVERALILCDGDPIEAESLRVALPAAGPDEERTRIVPARERVSYRLVSGSAVAEV